MKKYILVTESGSDLSKEFIDKYNIKIVPMHVNMGGETYRDNEIKAEDVFDYYDKHGVLPSTSGSTPNDFTETFQKITEENPEAEIIYIAYSSVTTVSYNSAKIAAEDFPKVHLIDSKNCTVGLASVFLSAAQFIENNPDTTPEEIVKFVEEVREKTRFVFLPQTLLYLKAGGRISNVSYLGAMILRIFPSIDLENGYLVAGKKCRGSFKSAYKNLFSDYFEKFKIKLETVKLIRVHGLKEDQQAHIEELLREKGVKEIIWLDAGPVISCHGGPGAMGIVGVEY